MPADGACLQATSTQPHLRFPEEPPPRAHTAFSWGLTCGHIAHAGSGGWVQVPVPAQVPAPCIAHIWSASDELLVAIMRWVATEDEGASPVTLAAGAALAAASPRFWRLQGTVAWCGLTRHLPHAATFLRGRVGRRGAAASAQLGTAPEQAAVAPTSLPPTGLPPALWSPTALTSVQPIGNSSGNSSGDSSGISGGSSSSGSGGCGSVPRAWDLPRWRSYLSYLGHRGKCARALICPAWSHRRCGSDGGGGGASAFPASVSRAAARLASPNRNTAELDEDVHRYEDVDGGGARYPPECLHAAIALCPGLEACTAGGVAWAAASGAREQSGGGQKLLLAAAAALWQRSASLTVDTARFVKEVKAPAQLFSR